MSTKYIKILIETPFLLMTTVTYLCILQEAFFGVPDELRKEAMKYLPIEFQNVVNEFENKYGNK